MILHSLDMPNDAPSLSKWLEDRLVSDELGELAAELSAAHPVSASRSETLESVLGSDLSAVLSRGLAALPEATLRKLVRHPWLLLDLQERIFIDGGPHWSRRTPTAAETDALAHVWSKVSAAIAAESKPSVNQVASSVVSTAGPRRASWIGTLSLAAAAFLIGLFLGGQWPVGPQPPVVAQTAWGWNKPGALKSDVSREVYLTNLAEGANEWFNKRPDSPAALATRISQFRQGCSMLILAEHKPLREADREWLRERCRAWAAKLDGYLTDLEAGGNVESIRTAADQTITTLMEKLRERAASA